MRISDWSSDVCSSDLKTERAVEYLEYLKREIAMQGELFDSSRKLTQLHLGGGTPTYFTSDQLADLMACMHQAYNMDDSDNLEFSLQWDPRTITPEQIPGPRTPGSKRHTLRGPAL